MVQRVILDGLWCGQGMANMVRVYKDSTVDPATTPADWLCLFDFGSGELSKTREALGVTPPVAFIMEQLKLQVAAGQDARIDVLAISHQDRDHWALLNELDKQIVAWGQPVAVKYMMLSGENWRQSSKEAVAKFEDRTANSDKDVFVFGDEWSDYVDPNDMPDPLKVGDMSVWTLITNVATNETSEDIERNCSSGVFLLQLGQLAFFLPGDATWETFARLEQIMSVWQKNPIPAVYAASVPHHGALRTMNRSTSTDTPDLRDLIWLTNYMRPYSIFASAGHKNTHSHPHLIILRTMGAHVGKLQFQARPIVYYDTPTDRFGIIPSEDANVYTTVLSLTEPVVTANWIFSITPTAHDTGVQVFNAGVPGILSAPQVSELELAAQRATEQQALDGTLFDGEFGDAFGEPAMVRPDPAYARSPVIWAGERSFTGGFPEQEVESGGMFSSPARPAASHAPQPTANAAPPPRRSGPVRRVKVTLR